jgi:hypothetical protein
MTTEQCADIGPYQRIYGICGGPTGDQKTYCLNPGKVLCEACPDDASMPTEYGGLGITCSAVEYDDSFWADAPNDKTTCCDELLTTVQFFEPTPGQPLQASRNAWLYDSFVSCTDIRSVYPVP